MALIYGRSRFFVPVGVRLSAQRSANLPTLGWTLGDAAETLVWTTVEQPEHQRLSSVGDAARTLMTVFCRPGSVL